MLLSVIFSTSWSCSSAVTLHFIPCVGCRLHFDRRFFFNVSSSFTIRSATVMQIQYLLKPQTLASSGWEQKVTCSDSSCIWHITFAEQHLAGRLSRELPSLSSCQRWRRTSFLRGNVAVNTMFLLVLISNYSVFHYSFSGSLMLMVLFSSLFFCKWHEAFFGVLKHRRQEDGVENKSSAILKRRPQILLQIKFLEAWFPHLCRL